MVTITCGTPDTDSIHVSSMTPLETSLMHSLKLSTTMKSELVCRITTEDNPRKL